MDQFSFISSKIIFHKEGIINLDGVFWGQYNYLGFECARCITQTEKEMADYKKEELSRKKGFVNWIMALAINSVVAFLAFAFTDMCYETNDDFAISSRIADGYPNASFVNYYLCKMLIAVQSQISKWNVYVIFLILISSIAFVFITKLVLDICDKLSVRLMMIALLIMYSFDHYSAIQFTKTSALVTTVGFIALTDSVICKKKIGSYIAAFVFIYLGAAIRYGTFTAVLGTALIAVLVWMMIDFRRWKEEEWFSPKSMVSVILIGVITAGAFGVIKLSDAANRSTPELKYYEEYNLYRSNVVDYPTYDYYDINKDSYGAIGIDENDISLIDKWFFDYDGAASLDNLKKIDSIERPQTDLKTSILKSVKKTVLQVLEGMRYRTTTGIHIIMLIIMAVAMFAALKPRHWLFIISMGIVAFGLYTVLFMKQRASYRVMYVADIGATLWLIYYFAVCSGRAPEDVKQKIALGFGVLMLASSLVFFVFLRENCASKYDRAAGTVMSEAKLEYFMEHSDQVYVWSTREIRKPREYKNPLLRPGDSDRNVFSTGGWGTLSPYLLGKMADYGIRNPIKDLIDSEKAFFVGNNNIEQLETYLTKWYAKDNEVIRMRQVDTMDGTAVWKVETVKGAQ